METIAPFTLTICSIDELLGHCDAGASHVLSILDPEWPVPEAFGSFGEHVKLELRFHDIVDDVAGMIPPNEGHVRQLLDFGRSLLAEPPPNAHLIVHCHAGVSRSSASMALILAEARPDVPAERIMAEILRIRPQAWPNLRMIEFGDRLLRRDRALIKAAHELYRTRLEARPELAEAMTLAGREREIAAGKAAGAPSA